MKWIIGLALVAGLGLALAGCTLPGAVTATPTLPPFPPISSKAPPVNTLAPLPTFTGAAPQNSTPTQSPTQPVHKSTEAAPTAIPKGLPSATRAAATQPATKVPTLAPSATRAASTPSAAQDTKIFLIALNDNGAAGPKIGCGDSVVGAAVTVPDPAAPLRGALDQLLAIKTQTYGQSGLYDSLFRSDLKLSSVTVSGGLAVIKLTGALTLGGTCDAPRVQAQLEQTALQFATVQKVNILVNGVNLATLLSQK